MIIIYHKNLVLVIGQPNFKKQIYGLQGSSSTNAKWEKVDTNA